MKKIVAFLIAISTMTLMTSCGSPIASDKALSVANQTTKVTEDYLAGSIGGDNAYEQIQNLYNDLDYIEDYTYEEKRDDSQKNADYQIRLKVLNLSASVLIDKTSGDADTYDNVQKDLDKLKKSIKEYD